MRVKVLDTESTRDDEVVGYILDTVWDVLEEVEDGVVIDLNGGVLLKSWEYEEVEE